MQEEHEWKKQQGGNNKHHDAYAEDGHQIGTKEEKDEHQKLLEQYTHQEIALLRALQHERGHTVNLEQSDGKRKSPQTNNRTQISIDETDQFSPDNWLPRSSDLIRPNGKHLLKLLRPIYPTFSMPRLLWEFHTIDISNGKLVLTMDDLRDNFDTINIPVALACDGNRRKELNMIKRSKGFDWGSGAVSCAYWKGPLLRDVLIAAGIPDSMLHQEGKRYWVNFEGLQYAMDATNE